MEIHERIKDRREAIGLSVQEVADYLNVAKTTVYRYESADIGNVGINKFVSLAKVLRTTPASLIGYTDGKNEERIYELFSRLNDTGKTKLIEYAEILCEVSRLCTPISRRQ